jgi:GNAT superfamily N-acetyltransferase
MIELRRVEADEDVDAFVAVRNAIDPTHALHTAIYRDHRAAPGRTDLLACVGGVPVAGGFVEPHHARLDGSTAYVSVRVLEEWRRQGIGTELFRAVSELARSAGWTELHSVARHDDVDTLDYLGKRAFVEVLRMQELSLDLGEAGDEVEPRADAELVLLGEELEPAAFEAAKEIYPDIPEEDGIWIGDFDTWRREELPDHALRDCSFAALADGELVAYATLLDRGEGLAVHGITGVRPAWRGRGLAVALKRAQIAAARRRGLRELRTTTAFANAPMLHVNERLGYRRGVAWIHLRGPLLDQSA